MYGIGFEGIFSEKLKDRSIVDFPVYVNTRNEQRFFRRTPIKDAETQGNRDLAIFATVSLRQQNVVGRDIHRVGIRALGRMLKDVGMTEMEVGSEIDLGHNHLLFVRLPILIVWEKGKCYMWNEEKCGFSEIIRSFLLFLQAKENKCL